MQLSQRFIVRFIIWAMIWSNAHLCLSLRLLLDCWFSRASSIRSPIAPGYKDFLNHPDEFSCVRSFPRVVCRSTLSMSNLFLPDPPCSAARMPAMTANQEEVNLELDELNKPLREALLDPDISAKVKALPKNPSMDDVVKMLKETGLDRIIEDIPGRPQRKHFADFFNSVCTTSTSIKNKEFPRKNASKKSENPTDKSNIDGASLQGPERLISYHHFVKYPLIHQWIDEGRIAYDDVLSSWRMLYGSPVRSIKLTEDEAFDLVHFLFDIEDVDDISFVNNLFRRLVEKKIRRDKKMMIFECTADGGELELGSVDNSSSSVSPQNQKILWRDYIKSNFIQEMLADEVFDYEDILAIACRALKWERNVFCDDLELDEEQFLRINRYILIDLSNK